MNPLFQYQVIKSSMVTGAHCPHCQHRFEVLRRDSQRELSCLSCGKKFKVSGQANTVHKYKKEK